MAKVPYDELNQLQSAADAKTVAESSEVESQTQSIAYAINTAANTGEKSVVYLTPLIPEVRTTLEAEGYTIEDRDAIPSGVVISWK